MRRREKGDIYKDHKKSYIIKIMSIALSIKQPAIEVQKKIGQQLH